MKTIIFVIIFFIVLLGFAWVVAGPFGIDPILEPVASPSATLK